MAFLCIQNDQRTNKDDEKSSGSSLDTLAWLALKKLKGPIPKPGESYTSLFKLKLLITP